VSELDLLTETVAQVPARCGYAEARWLSERHERVAVRGGRVDELASDRREGIGVRVRVDGAWVFAATRDVSAAGARRALARAVALAHAQPPTSMRTLAPVEPARGHWSSPCARDPFAVSMEEKVELLAGAEAAMRGDRRIVRSEAECQSRRTDKAFASTEGAACTQRIVECGGGIRAVAVDDVRSRCAPTRALTVAAWPPRAGSTWSAWRSRTRPRESRRRPWSCSAPRRVPPG